MEGLCSIDKALDSLSNHNFRQKNFVDKIYRIKFNINEKIADEFNEISFSRHFPKKHSVLITFQSIVKESKSKTFWRLSGKEKFYELEYFEGMSEAAVNYFHNFLFERVKHRQSGILINPKGRLKFDIRDIGTDMSKNGYDVLTSAVEENKTQIVKELLLHDFDIDKEFTDDSGPFNVIDKASSTEIKMLLLYANSKFPKNFKIQSASQEEKDFVNRNKTLHKLIEEKKILTLKKELRERKIKLSRHYNEENKSLMACALESKDPDFVRALVSHKISIGFHESSNLDELYEGFTDENLNKICSVNISSAISFPKIHILFILSKSKVGSNDQHERWSKINQIIERLEKDESFSKILQVITKHESLEIIYDFKHDTTYYQNPKSASFAKGITYPSGTIYIGAKNLLNESLEDQAISTIIHEFCHLAVNIVFMNKFNPYQIGESKEKDEFIKVFNDCRLKKDHEGVVAAVFNEKYPDKEQHAELIVRVPHMRMKYCENHTQLKLCENYFETLFKYYKDTVEHQFDEFLKVIKLLQNKFHVVGFEKITVPMKAKVLHSKINFQGERISFFEIFQIEGEISEDNAKILTLLTSDEIKNIIFDREVFKLGESCETTSKYGYNERKFIKYNANDYENFEDEDNEVEDTEVENDMDVNVEDECAEDENFGSENGEDREVTAQDLWGDNIGLSFKEIKDEAKKCQIFILIGKAGDGKTTTFQYSVKKLKKDYANHWVSFVKLRSFKEIFEDNSEKGELNLDEIFEILYKILSSTREGVNKNFELAILKKLLTAGQTILLLDGVDEISPDFNDFIIKMILTLIEKTENQIWVSTRPQHSKKLEENLKVKITTKFSGEIVCESFSLMPYDEFEREDLIKKVMRDHKNYSKEVEPSEFVALDNFFTANDENFNNPLLIQIITNLFMSNIIDLISDSYNYYEIFDKMAIKKMEEAEPKFDHEDRNYKLNSQFLFHFLSLRFLFNDNLVKDLTIMKQWYQEEKFKWTPEKIQRSGIANVSSDFMDNCHKNSINFLNFMMAEFFATQYITDSIFSNFTRDEDIEKIFDILKLYRKEAFSDYFLESFLTHDSNFKHRKLNEKIKQLIKSEINLILDSKDGSPNLKFWFLFLRNEKDMMREIWNDQKLLERHLFGLNPLNGTSLNSLLDAITICLGENWHDFLNRSDQKMITNEDIKKIESERQMRNMSFSRSFYKLLDFVQKNFDSEEKVNFKVDFLFDFDIALSSIECFYQKEVFQKISTIFSNENDFILEVLGKFMSYSYNFENLKYFLEKLEEMLEGDHKRKQQILQNELKNLKIKQLFEENMDSENLASFLTLLRKYITNEELQCLFVSWKNIFTFLDLLPKDIHLEFSKIMKEIFNSNKNQILECINYDNCPTNIKSILAFEAFLINYFNGERNDHVNYCMRKILFRTFYSCYIHQFTCCFRSKYDFQKIKEIHQQYQNSPNELFWKIFLDASQDIFTEFKSEIEEIFVNTKQLDSIKGDDCAIKIITSEFAFNLFEKFSIEFFQDNMAKVRDSIQKIFEDSKYCKQFTNNTNAEDQKHFKKIKKIFFFYLETLEFREKHIPHGTVPEEFKYRFDTEEKIEEFLREIFNIKSGKHLKRNISSEQGESSSKKHKKL